MYLYYVKIIFVDNFSLRTNISKEYYWKQKGTIIKLIYFVLIYNNYIFHAILNDQKTNICKKV